MNTLFEKVSNKVELLVKSYQKLSKENENLIEERKSLLGKIDALANQVEELQSNLEKIKISSSLEGGGQDSILARKKINMFLREIDKCITLLSN